jgi:hypothetical protein
MTRDGNIMFKNHIQNGGHFEIQYVCQRLILEFFVILANKESLLFKKIYVQYIKFQKCMLKV